MSKRKTTEQFIKDAQKVHGDKYDYSDTVYEKSDKILYIWCKKHDWEFSQRAGDHLQGKGCKVCGNEGRAKRRIIPIEQFIKRSKEKHGSKYDYSKVVFSGVDNKVEIICSIHGHFSQRPAKHMKGEGCMECGIKIRANKRRNSLNKILNTFKEAHGDKYDYSKVDYERVDKHVLILCKEHDYEFTQSPYHHSLGETGCKLCQAASKRKMYIKTQADFIKDSKEIHGSLYDYSRADYKGAKVDVEIGCSNKSHGYFLQKPDHHINGKHGCPICAEEIRSLGFTVEQINKDKIQIDGLLYVINAFNENENFFKIGITSKTAAWRFRGNSEMPYDYEILCELNIGLVDAYEHEQYILDKYKEYKYVPKIYFAGKDEVLSINPLEHDERLKELYSYQKDL